MSHSNRPGRILAALISVSLTGTLCAQPVATNSTGQTNYQVEPRLGGFAGGRGGDPAADRTHMMQVLHLTLPTLPPPAEDTNRPPGTVRIPNNQYNWDDGKRGKDGRSVIDTITRSEWGTWNNYDWQKADLGPMPDALICNDAQPVKTPQDWTDKRRPEIEEMFHREIYGRVPADVPKVTWEVTGVTTNEAENTITKRMVGHVDNSRYTNISVNIGLTYTIPVDATGPVPVIFRYGTGFGAFGGARGRATGFDVNAEILRRHWGYGFYDNASVQPNSGGGLCSGIIGLMNRGEFRQPDDWGALMAWAWGFDRCIDFLETDPAVDAHKLGLEGHSYLGKATIVAMAFDPRLAIAFSSCAGEAGTKLYRHHLGEDLENSCGPQEYYEMAGNFLKYAGHVTDLPVDANELIALCAPRPVLVTGGTEDLWCDPLGEFKACAAAGPVYKLLGKQDLGTTEMPLPDQALISGDLAFRLHEGGHTDVPDWPIFLQFCDKYFGRSKAAN